MNELVCPFCQSNNMIKAGFSTTLHKQLYRCKDCQRRTTFSDQPRGRKKIYQDQDCPECVKNNYPDIRKQKEKGLCHRCYMRKRYHKKVNRFSIEDESIDKSTAKQ